MRLNYHHLLYFWTVAREGGVAKASERLHLAPPTISGQIHALEDSLGKKLFHHRGRRFELTDDGRVVYQYADEIFTVGQELTETLKGSPKGWRLQIGIVTTMPRIIVHRLL